MIWGTRMQKWNSIKVSQRSTTTTKGIFVIDTMENHPLRMFSMTSGPFKILLSPAGKIFQSKQQKTLIRFYSPICSWKTRRKYETTVRCLSDSHPNIIRSSYAPIELPEMPFHEYIFENMEQWEDKIAVECGATGKKFTYKEIYRCSKNLAASLQNNFNLKKGDAQAILLPNCPEYPTLFIAGSMAGVVSTTVNPNYTPTELSLQLNIVKPKILFTIPETYKKCIEALNLINLKIPIVVVKNHPEAEIPPGAVSYSELAEGSTFLGLNPVNFDLDDDLVIPFSSGTSGFPKGVQLTHKSITANLAQFVTGNNLKSSPNKETNQSIILGILPMFHIYGMVVVTFDVLRCGGRLVSLPKFDPKLFIETIYTKKTELLYLAPPLIFFLANTPLVESKHLRNVQHVMNGAAPCGDSDIEKLLKKAPNLDVSQGYGMTETSPVVTISHKDRFHKTASVGHPLTLTLIKICDTETGKALPRGSHGEICVKGPQVMKGYFNNLEETKKTFDSEGWLKTGDIGYCDEENDLFIVDRLKELIKVKGYQVAPAELEEILRSHPKIADAGVIGVAHPEMGEVPKAFVVLKEGVSAKEEEIQEFIKEKLSSYKQLRGGVRFMDVIPKSTSGKILRRNLKKMKENS